MFTILLHWLASIFTAEKIGVLVRIILMRAGKTVLRDLLNVKNQLRAYEFVKELNKRDDLTNKEKAKLFNQKFAMWAATGGKKIKESVINCLREMAVAAVKAERR